MTSTVTALITVAGTIIGALISGTVSLIVSSKQHNKSIALIEYRLKELEAKQDKHNSLIERMAIVERDLKTAFKRIDENREEIKVIERT